MPVLIYIPKYLANYRSVDVTALDCVHERARNKNAWWQPSLRIFPTFRLWSWGGEQVIELARKNSPAAEALPAAQVLTPTPPVELHGHPVRIRQPG
jgi:hypothetical protein